jgi:hypothetical protein
MAVQSVRYRITAASGVPASLGYQSDIGGNLAINPVFRPHVDFTEALIDAIFLAIGAERREETIPCGESGDFSPRKLKFIRENGRSFSLVLGNRANVITAASAVVTAIANANLSRVICVELEGEKTANIIDNLSTKTEVIAAARIIPNNNIGNKLIYSSVMRNYASDAPYGTARLIGFRSQTDVQDSPYSELVDVINGCTGDITEVACGNAIKNFTYRRFIAGILTAADDEADAIQNITIPVAKHLPLDVLDCGTQIANSDPVACLFYEGQSD